MVGQKIEKALREISKWNYAANEKGDDFVKRVVNCLQKNIGAAIIWGSPGIKDEIPIGITIFSQPYGSQSSPDIAIIKLEAPLKIIKKTGWIPKEAFTMEVKRTGTGKAMWNSGFPTQDRIYLLNTKNKNINGTTIVLGEDLVSEKDEQKVIKLKNTLKEIKEQWAKIGNFKLEHLRPMFTQNADDGNWLLHPQRKEREEKVLKYVKDKYK